MPKENPKISVFMPVYNGENFLRQSIQSILEQTFTDFELIIVDDASTDGSLAVIQSFTDPRIRVYPLPTNQGPGVVQNQAFLLATGKYLALMDCDDISLPDRLARQVSFLDSHENVGVCGTWYECFGSLSEVRTPPIEHEDIDTLMPFWDPIANPTAMVRRDLIEHFQLRYVAGPAHDYGLWARLAPLTRLHNLPEVLLKYRVHAGQVSSTRTVTQNANADKVRKILLQDLGLSPGPEEMDLHSRMGRGETFADYETLKRAGRWLSCLYHINLERHRYHPRAWERVLAKVWFRSCQAQFRAKTIGIYLSYPAGWYRGVDLHLKSRFLWKCLKKSILRRLRGKSWITSQG